MATVLIVDDSPGQVAYIRELLKGLRVLHRKSATLENWRLLSSQADLVLIALVLTRENGFEVGLRLRERGFHNIVLYSDCPEETDADWAGAIGLQGLLQLPAPMQALRRQIHSHLNCDQGSEDGERWAS